MNTAKFDKAFDEWVQHCRMSPFGVNSSGSHVRKSPAFEAIVAMGYEALPCIRAVYDHEATDDLALATIKLHGLTALVLEIIGEEFSIPPEIQGNVVALESYTKQWLDGNMHRYLPVH